MNNPNAGGGGKRWRIKRVLRGIQVTTYRSARKGVFIFVAVLGRTVGLSNFDLRKVSRKGG